MKRFEVEVYHVLTVNFGQPFSKITDAFGAVTWWGFSPALDLQEKGLNPLSYHQVYNFDSLSRCKQTRNSHRNGCIFSHKKAI